MCFFLERGNKLNQIIISGKIKEINHSEVDGILELIIETEKGNRNLLCNWNLKEDVEVGNSYVFKGECINSPFKRGTVQVCVDEKVEIPKYAPLEQIVIIGLTDEEFQEHQNEIRITSLDNGFIYVNINDSMQESLYPYLENGQTAIGIKGCLKEEDGYLKVEVNKATILYESQEQTIEMKM